MHLPMKAGDQFEVTADLLQAYRAAYPHIDVERQFGLMRIWLERNKSARPKNGARFVDNWMKRQRTAVARLAPQLAPQLVTTSAADRNART
jgi:hypothetical protein